MKFHHGRKDFLKKTSIQCTVIILQNKLFYYHFFVNYFLQYTELGALSQAGLTSEIKKLYDQAYQLGVEEAREMTRGKYLNIFSQTNRKK